MNAGASNKMKAMAVGLQMFFLDILLYKYMSTLIFNNLTRNGDII